MSDRLSLLSTHIDPNSPYSQFDSTPENDRRWVSQTGVKDIEKERRKASFDPRKMNYFLHDGEKNAILREKFMLEFERDPTFRMDDVHDLTKPQIRERIVHRLRSIAHYATTDSVYDFTTRINTMILVDPGFTTRCAVHYGLFVSTIINQGISEQSEYWKKKGMWSLDGMIGCFAMTEIGHGSNVAGIETTATFDKATDEFIIHSPTLTSTKFWIGGASETATHSYIVAVFANLVIDGKNYGAKPFVVQLRDPKTYALCPGVNIGDCGAKMGRNGIDNGWIQFTFVRIPRSNMLMKYTKVSRGGKVTEPAMSQLAYSSLVFGRTNLIRESVEMAKKALVIAIRYAVVRKQFASTKNGPEKAIMDYKTHQYRLIPLLACTYAMQFWGLQIRHSYEELLKEFESAYSEGKNLEELIGKLKEIHATSAGAKAMTTWKVLEIIEQSRQSCGGLGYLSYVNLAAMYQDHAVQCTWEGDNTILTLQTGRYLISQLVNALKGENLPEGVAYLHQIQSNVKKTCSPIDFKSLEMIQEAFDFTCANLVAEAGKTVEDFMSQGSSQVEALEKSAANVFVAAEIHCLNQLFMSFRKALAKAEDPQRPILGSLCGLLGLTNIQRHAGLFLQFGYFKPEHMPSIGSAVLELMQTIRLQVIPLTDAFGLSDFVINSPLGCYDGDVYRRLMERVLQSNPQGPHPYFERAIKPMLFRTKQEPDAIQMQE